MMRRFIQIVENAQGMPQTLQEAAEWFVAVNDDILPDQYLDVEWSEATDQQCCKLIERVMLHGDCHPFATALHDKTGWPMFHMMDDEGSSHYVCKTPDGQMVDFSGYVTMPQIKRRYRLSGQIHVREETESGYMSDHDEAILLATLRLYFAVVDCVPLTAIFR